MLRSVEKIIISETFWTSCFGVDWSTHIPLWLSPMTCFACRRAQGTSQGTKCHVKRKILFDP
ncbi:MAG TPA: hypothetical protein PKW11_13150, partial [Pseudomonadota bacterium]|nr:hypothetical protein [Pseudomonadota bacterium]